VSPVATSYPRPGGGRNLTMPPAAVISVSTAARGGGGEEASGEGGEVLVTLTAQRKPFHYEADFRALGIEPSSHPLLVVKIGYLVPDLERMAACNLMALSPGAVYADVATMPYKRISRPVYPLDKEIEWTPTLA
jgi:microcystin degradation protein MlrC